MQKKKKKRGRGVERIKYIILERIYLLNWPLKILVLDH